MSAVYFVQCGPDGPIKIGRATDVRRRIILLQTGCPYELRLLATLNPAEFSEEELHAKFDDLRMRGEWFHPGKALLEFIAAKGKEMTLGRASVRLVSRISPANPMRRLRKEMGLTQSQLAAHLAMHQSHVSRAECAESIHPRLQLALLGLRDRLAPVESAAA